MTMSILAFSPQSTWRPPRIIPLLALAVLLAGCGTHGDPSTLPLVAHATLSAPGSHQQAGTATLTPFYGGRIVAYLAGHEIPYDNAQTPVQLRSGSCAGPLLAALTANAPGPAASAAQSTVVTRPDPSGGADVAVDPEASWYIVVLDHAGDPHASAVACGAPLSGQQQYFDLYPPDVGSNGTARGMALLQPQIYTRVAVTLTQPAGQNEPWALHQQSCGGATIASGTIASGAKTSQGIAFAAPVSGGWWASVGTGSGSLCGQAK
jgi:hypothetical protein